MLLNEEYKDNTSDKNKKHQKKDNYINKEKNNEFSKEELQNIKYLSQYIKSNCVGLYDKLENFEYLDSGAESNVYCFNFKGNTKKYIMKLIIKEKRKKRNKLEIDISQKLKHKNIINCIDYIPIKENESECVIMEHGTFGNLRQFLKNILNKNYFTESMLCYISFQILNGLKYCQNYKIVHYDLKPENIIIDNMLNIKIIDYSISYDYSKIKDEEIQLYFSGTGLFMAPEVIKCQTIKLKDINKIDLYSLGVILYRLFFGCYPFCLTQEDSKDYDTIYEKIMNNNLEIDVDYEYSEHFADFITKLLEKDINKRININQALEHYWIKGADILMNEKEKLFNANIFIADLITDSFYNFNQYLKGKVKK